MRFSASAFVLALASSVLAADPTPDFDAVNAPASGQTLKAGSTFDVTWTTIDKYMANTVAISLIGGPDQPHLQTLSTIATGVKNSDQKYSWAIDSSLGTLALYGLVFTNEQNTTIFQYSNPFHIEASAASGNASSTTTITTSVGTKTVSLTSAPTTTSMTMPASNMSTTATISSAAAGKTTITTHVAPSATTSAPATQSTGAGAQATVGSMLGLVGFALAALAM